MSEKQSLQKEEKYQFESFYVFALLFKNKWFIISTTIVGIIASVIISLMLPNWFMAQTNVVPPNERDSGMGSALGGISSTLREIGLTKLGGQGGESYTYLVILQSRTVVDSMISKFDLGKVYEIPDSNMSAIRKTFSGNVDITYEKEGNYTISVWDKDPVRAAEMANEYIELANNVAVRISREESRMNTEYLEKRINKIDSAITHITDTLQRFSKEYMVFSFEDQAKSIAGAYSDLKAEQMQYSIMYELFRNTYGEQDAKTKDLKELSNIMKEKIEDAENKPGFGGEFPLKDATEVGLNYMKLYVELETYSKVKAYLMPSLEEARLKEVKNIKNLFVVDKAIVPDKKDKPKRSLIVVGAAIGTFSIAVLAILLLNAFRNFKRKYNEFNESN